MTDPHSSPGPEPGDAGWRVITETLEEFARAQEGDPGAVPAGGGSGVGNVEEAWERLRSLHLLVDERRDEGRISAGRARELRSRLLDLSRRIAREAVEEESRAYQRLLRDVAHDIRSPLHSIIFLSEALYSRAEDGVIGESRRRQLGTIYAAGTSLLNLVNDLLDYARMAAGEGGEVSEEPFTLDSVLADVRHLLGPLVEHYDTEFTVRSRAEDRFVGDRQILCRVLTNLVSNGVEAAGRDGRVEVEITSRQGGLEIAVVDDGDDADIDQIECLLAQPGEETLADCVGEQRRGRTHGLGLLICGRLVRAAGGEAGAERVELAGGNGDSRHGTRGTVWLPFGPESDAA